jgi:hypothetical protein
MANTHDLSPEEAFCALYHYALVLGMGMLQARPGGMTLEEARERLARSPYVDYHRGRVHKVDFSKVSIYHEVDERLYDRDNGRGAAQTALDDYVTTPQADRAAKFHTVRA